jgi:hypothetical protein
VDTSKNIQPKRKKNPIAAVRYVIGGKSNKITRIIFITIRMPQIVNDMIDIVSVVFLDIGYSGACLRYKLFGIKKNKQLYNKGGSRN